MSKTTLKTHFGVFQNKWHFTSLECAKLVWHNYIAGPRLTRQTRTLPRSAAGLLHLDGTAVMLTFNHISDMITHLHKLFKICSSNASYQVVPVSFVPDNKSWCHPSIIMMILKSKTTKKLDIVGRYHTGPDFQSRQKIFYKKKVDEYDKYVHVCDTEC